MRVRGSHVVNLLDKIYELRDGSGIGVGAPQFGQRRGFYGTVYTVSSLCSCSTTYQQNPWRQ